MKLSSVFQQSSYRSNISSLFTEDTISKLKEIMYERKVSPGSYLFMEGDQADKLFFVVEGKVKISKATDDGKEFIIYFLQDGDLFGELGGIELKYSFNAEVLEDSTIGIIQQTDLDILLYQYGDLAVQFVKWMGLMQRTTQSKFRDLMLYGKPGALCSTLIRLTNSHGAPVKDGILITLKLTNTELANLIGTTRESVNRILSDLKSSGIIGYDNGSIIVKDLEYLRSVCNCSDCPKEICRL